MFNFWKSENCGYFPKNILLDIGVPLQLKIPFWVGSIFIYVDQHHKTSEHLSAPQLAHLQSNHVTNLKSLWV